jgi:hypothetical protein
METRFLQLDVATSLELWQEGFRSLEDIKTLMAASTRPPHASLLARYYEKLAMILWQSNNFLVVIILIIIELLLLILFNSFTLTHSTSCFVLLKNRRKIFQIRNAKF